MHYLLLLATASLAIAANTEKEVQPELNSAESASPIRVHDDEHRYRFEDGLELMRSRDEHSRMRIEDFRDNRRKEYRDGHDGRQGPVRVDFKDDDFPGPLILRSPDPLPSHGHPDIERQNKIIADVYSPDYYQPTWVLDYRYLKTGGRDYTRGPGGQILILPKNVRTNEHKEFPDFDALLEHLRLSRLSERARSSRRGHGDDHDGGHGYPNFDHGHVGREQHGQHGQYGYQQHNQHNPWKSNRNPMHP
ncbi:hypothetical protein PYW08_014665 [Mythimna loreyi]|uniref:Uncharacterized protein n=1 Tax=Mythimna loreyi TaxID=667449 RepID=A0ACC2R2L2_9NEOP|nr:hypothetical protein PYW08_014665 [Mythimna loreyi]